MEAAEAWFEAQATAFSGVTIVVNSKLCLTANGDAAEIWLHEKHYRGGKRKAGTLRSAFEI